MFEIQSGTSAGRFCDGHSRRGFLKVGALGFGGLSLAHLLASDAQAGTSARKKCFINIYLGGGPSHIDTFDLKPNAPSEIRGEFRGIPTAIPGYQHCELMPKLAERMGDVVVIRGLDQLRDEHNSSQSETGWESRALKSIGGRPSVGSVVARLEGGVNGAAPTFVDFNGHGRAGFLGPIYNPYKPDGEGRANLTLNRGLTVDRLSNRRSLLSQLDGLRREADNSGQMEALDAFTERAVSVVTGGDVARALDLNNEDPRTRERYGAVASNRRKQDCERLLLARRLIESGVRCVSLSWGGWDTHQNNFTSLREQLPYLDMCLSSLLEDLRLRGMIDDVLVSVSGEFGRTPRINGNAGRDHWAKTGFFLLAGGGLPTGQVIGSTNRLGEVPQDRPVPIQEVFCTIYHTLGINCETTTFIDPNGRPQYLTDVRQPMPELV
jgi:hypothetical protein